MFRFQLVQQQQLHPKFTVNPVSVPLQIKWHKSAVSLSWTILPQRHLSFSAAVCSSQTNTENGVWHTQKTKDQYFHTMLLILLFEPQDWLKKKESNSVIYTVDTSCLIQLGCGKLTMNDSNYSTSSVLKHMQTISGKPMMGSSATSSSPPFPQSVI